MKSETDPATAPAAGERSPSEDLAPWWGWVLVAALALIVLATWLPSIALPLGDSHEGRILARFGLHVRNFWRDGPLASGLATDLSPYPAAANYAHHPPLINAAHVAVSGLFGQGVVQLRLVGYAAGMGTIFAGAALLRALRIRWIPVLAALAAMVATPMFWIYGRLGGGYSLVLALAAAIVALRESEAPPTWMVVTGSGLALTTAMMSWPAALTTAVLGLWLLRRRGWDRPTVLVGLSMVAGFVLSGLWILQATSLSELLGQAETRTTGLGFTTGEWIARQWRWLDALLPNWYLLLLGAGLVVSIWRLRTRFLTLALLAVTVLWAIALPSGSYVHDFWNLSLLAAGLIAIAALFDWLVDLMPARAVIGLGLAGTAVWMLAFAGLVSGPIFSAYFEQPAAAGRLLATGSLARGQEVWTDANIAAPRWVSWYWDVPVGRVTAENLDSLPDTAVVILRADRLPDWLDPSVAGRALASEGRYLLISAADLKAFASA